MSNLDSLITENIAGTFILKQHLSDFCLPKTLDKILRHAELLFKDMVVEVGSVFTPVFSFNKAGDDIVYLHITCPKAKDLADKHLVKLRVIPKFDGYSDGLDLFEDDSITEYSNWITFRAGLMEPSVRTFYDRLPRHKQKTLQEFLKFTEQANMLYQNPVYQVINRRVSLTIDVLNDRQSVFSFSISL